MVSIIQLKKTATKKWPCSCFFIPRLAAEVVPTLKNVAIHFLTKLSQSWVMKYWTYPF